jgi:hypothetical protein
MKEHASASGNRFQAELPSFQRERGKSVRHLGKKYVDATDWGELANPAGSAKEGFSLLKH